MLISFDRKWKIALVKSAEVILTIVRCRAISCRSNVCDGGTGHSAMNQKENKPHQYQCRRGSSGLALSTFVDTYMWLILHQPGQNHIMPGGNNPMFLCLKYGA